VTRSSVEDTVNGASQSVQLFVVKTYDYTGIRKTLRIHLWLTPTFKPMITSYAIAILIYHYQRSKWNINGMFFLTRRMECQRGFETLLGSFCFAWNSLSWQYHCHYHLWTLEDHHYHCLGPKWRKDSNEKSYHLENLGIGSWTPNDYVHFDQTTL
jgi:hypothetical protein